MRTTRQAATAMNCTFVYAFVPVEPLEAIVRERAARKAREEIDRLDHTMRLENQALRPSDLDEAERRTIERLVTGTLRGLWEEA